MRTVRLIVGLALTSSTLLSPHLAHAAKEDLYERVKELVEREMTIDEAELAVQRFAVGVYYDHELETVEGTGTSEVNVPFEIEDENYVDLSIQTKHMEMCGDKDGNQTGKKNDYLTCLQAQDILKRSVTRSAWHRKLGRNLQMITSGYESGIDGYPGKVINVIPRFSSIAHMWRASNDTFVSPFVEELTRARPWPKGKEEDIQDKASEVEELLDDMIRKWQEGETKKEDDTEKVAAVWRYRHGVQHVITLEGPCADAPEFPLDPANIWLERRWCDLEDKLIEIRDILQLDSVEPGNDQHIVYPSVINKKKNLFLWMRYDDVGTHWYIPFEPVQAALYHPDFGDCIESDTPRNCYDTLSSFIVRGGRYPKKIGDEEVDDSHEAVFEEEIEIAEDDQDTDEDIRRKNAVVPEPKEKEGICSHPFAKRGYLCRRVEYEACDLTKKQQEELEDADKSGIVLTRCQPERFKDDVARKTAGTNICGIGGWREEVSENLTQDTPEKQPDMKVNKCAACAVDVVCSDNCIEGKPGFAFTSYYRRNDVIEVCVPNQPKGKGMATYLLAHELVHAQQNCNDSNLQTLERTGLRHFPGTKDPAACCASEREAYFVQCKMYAQDGILDKAGVTIDQCASAYANFSCESHDDDKEDEDYPCTNDEIDPKLVAKAVNTALNEMENLNTPSTCAGAFNDPRIKALRNSFPRVCRPGCESKYQNTIGNNLCYTGQCLEEMQETARQGTGRMGLTTVDEDFPWDSCELPDPKLGEFELPPALTAPKFPQYRPALVLQQLDHALCQINGLPARTPPIICSFNPQKRLGLPPLRYTQSADDLTLQPEEYASTGLGIEYAASGIGARLAGDMFAQYLTVGSRQFTDLLNMTYHIFDNVSDIKFPTTMCSRADGNVSCNTYRNNR